MVIRSSPVTSCGLLVAIFLSDNGIINALLAKIGLGPFPMLNSVFGTMIGYLTEPAARCPVQLFSLIFVDRTLVEAAHNLRCSQAEDRFRGRSRRRGSALTIAALFCFIPDLSANFVSPFISAAATRRPLSILITDTTKSGQRWPRRRRGARDDRDTARDRLRRRAVRLQGRGR